MEAHMDHNDIVLLANLSPSRRVQAWMAEQQASADAPETILITAYADLDRAEEALRHGAADFVLKPFRTSQLLHVVRRCLRDARRRRRSSSRRCPAAGRCSTTWPRCSARRF